MKGFKFVLVLIFTIAYPLCSMAWQMDILVNKLVEKKIISQEDAKDILSEVWEEESESQEAQRQVVASQVKEEVEKAQTESFKDTALPDWIKNTKFGGDLRLRYEREGKEENGMDAVDRHRGRFRIRYGLETKVNDMIKVGLRFASGSGEQTSTNQTMQDTFSQKNFWIDRAFLEFTPISEVKFTGGKMGNPFYTTDLVWDPDITPEGFVMSAQKTFGGFTPFATAGFFPIDESSSDSNDVSLYGVQGGFEVSFLGMKFKGATGYYDFHNMEGSALQDISPAVQKTSNTLIEGADDKDFFRYDYSLINTIFEFTPVEFHISDRAIPVTIIGDFVNNIASDVNDNSGWLGGIKIGKVKNPGDFGIFYNYRELEKDAIPAAIADSDFHGGGTNSKGHKIGVQYGLFKNTTFGLTYFNTRSQEKKDNIKINLLQADLVVKF